MKKRILLSFSLLLIATALFTVCDDNETSTSDNNTGGSASINGGWYMNLSSGTVALISISGANASVGDRFDVSCLNPLSTWVSAVNKGIVKTGTPYLKNIQSKNNKKWSCLMMAIQYNSVPEATGLQYLPATFTLSDDNQEIYLSFDSNPTLRTGTLSKTYINNGCSGGSSGGGTTSNTGSITVWLSKDYGCGQISVTISGVGSGTLTQYFPSGTPECGQSGTVTFNNVKYGTYTLSASCSSYSWSATINLSQSCYLMGLK